MSAIIFVSIIFAEVLFDRLFWTASFRQSTIWVGKISFMTLVLKNWQTNQLKPMTKHSTLQLYFKLFQCHWYVWSWVVGSSCHWNQQRLKRGAAGKCGKGNDSCLWVIAHLNCTPNFASMISLWFMQLDLWFSSLHYKRPFLAPLFHFLSFSDLFSFTTPC